METTSSTTARMIETDKWRETITCHIHLGKSQRNPL